MFFTPVNPPEFWEDDDEEPTEEADDGADDYYDWCREMYRFED